MKLLSEKATQAIIERIVMDFGGGGDLNEFGILLNSVREMPEGVACSKMNVSDAMQDIADVDLIAVLEVDARYPTNFDTTSNYVRNVLTQLGAADFDESRTNGIHISKDELQRIISFMDGDMFVTDQQGRLLMVACHEDELDQNNERIVWTANYTSTQTGAKP